MSLAEWSGQRVEYAIRYVAPEAFRGTIAQIRHTRELAEAVKRSEESRPGGDVRCVVVSRTVSYSEWTDVDGDQ